MKRRDMLALGAGLSLVEPTRALAQAGAARGPHVAVLSWYSQADAERLKAVVGQIRGDLGEDVFDRAASDGAALTEPALVAFVQERIAVLVAGSRS